MTANGVDNVVTVLQGAVEDIVLPIEEDGLDPDAPIDIMIRLVHLVSSGSIEIEQIMV